MGLDNPVVRDLPVPGGEGNVKATDFGPWQLLHGLEGVPVLHPLACLSGHVQANPSALRVAAVVHAPERHIPDNDLARLPEAQNAPWKAF
jgi:hypothetical protein